MLDKHQTFFVSGIDTEVGKTIVSAILVEALSADYWKAIQCGDLDHSDAHKVAALISNKRSKIHPETYRLKNPMSPHAAAAIENIEIKLSDFEVPDSQNHLIIEGAGGLMVPFNKKDCMIDLMERLNFPVILVSKIYLGSINHSLLSIEALKRRNIPIKGIVFVGEENKSTEDIIFQQTQVPVLGRIDWMESITKSSIKKAVKNIKLKSI